MEKNFGIPDRLFALPLRLFVPFVQVTSLAPGRVHEQQDAYSLNSYPIELARQQDCQLRRKGHADRNWQSGDVGGFFAVSFTRKNAGESPPILTLVWSQEKDRWETISFDVETN